MGRLNLIWLKAVQRERDFFLSRKPGRFTDEHSVQQLQQVYATHFTEAQSFFSELKEIVSLREQQFMAQLPQIHKVQCYLTHTQQYFQELANLSVLTEVQILNNTSIRHAIANSISKSQVVVGEPPRLNKDNEVNCVVKSLLALVKATKKSATTRRRAANQRASDSPVYIQLTFSKNMSEIRSTIKSANSSEVRSQQKKTPQSLAPPPRIPPEEQKNDDSMQEDFQSFLHNLESDTSEGCLSKSDISHVYQQLNYNFISFGRVRQQRLNSKGGFVDSVSDAVEKYDPKSDQPESYGSFQSNYQKQIKLLSIIYRFGAAQMLNGNFLLIGGKKDGSRISGCHEYSYREKWVKPSKVALSSPRSGVAVVVTSELIFVLGGNNGAGAVTQVEVFNQIKQTWKKLRSMAEKRDELAAVLWDDKIYALGGSNGSQCLSTCEKYDCRENRWEFAPSMKFSRRAHCAAILPDGMYAIGGFNGSNYLKSVEKFDEQASQWVQIGSLNHARCNFSALPTPDNQFIYVFGGFDHAPLDSVEKYSIVSNCWEVTKPLLNKRFMHCTIIAQKH